MNMLKNSLHAIQHVFLPKFIIRTVASTSQQRLYELRMYTIKPKNTVEFMKLTNDLLHLRTKHSKLLGYWLADLGAINRTYHIWEYDNYAHRSQIRTALANDPVWQEQYLKKMLALIDKQKNVSMRLISDIDIKTPSSPGCYEYQQYHLKNSLIGNGNAKVMVEAFKNNYQRFNSSLIGAFTTDFGPENGVHLFWHHESFDAASQAKQVLKSDSNSKTVPFWNDVSHSVSVAMMPAKISPML